MLLLVVAGAFELLVGCWAYDAPNQVLKSKLKFPKKEHSVPDDWPEFVNLSPKLNRWIRQNNTLEADPVNMNEEEVEIQSAEGKPFNVVKQGFERVRLNPNLLPILQEVRKNGLSGARVGPTTAGSWLVFLGGGNDDTVEDKLALNLQGSESFSLREEYHYAFRCSGFVIRKGGPEGSKIDGAGFDQVAQRVHIDQDQTGEPLLSMGLTWIFKLPNIYLLNVWSPLYDIRMRPMAFVDINTVNVEKEVMRYRTNSTANAGGKFGSFRSDRLMSLYSPSHKWYYYPRVKHGDAIAFDTGKTPHNSFTMPGEQVLGEIRNQIVKIKEEKQVALCGGEGDRLIQAVYASIKQEFPMEMIEYIGVAKALKERVCAKRDAMDAAEYAYVLEYLSRASLEIRCVTYIGKNGF